MVDKLTEKYKGKAKTLYTTDDPSKFYCEFRDDTSAFNGVKVESLDRKGLVNNYFNAHIMQHLENNGVATHFVERVADDASLVKKLDMFPLECVVRNVAAGSICKRLGLEKGQRLKIPLPQPEDYCDGEKRRCTNAPIFTVVAPANVRGRKAAGKGKRHPETLSIPKSPFPRP